MISVFLFYCFCARETLNSRSSIISCLDRSLKLNHAFSNLVVSCALVSVAARRLSVSRLFSSTTSSIRTRLVCSSALYWLCSSFSCCILAIWPLVIFAFSARRKSIDESSLLYNAALVAFLALPLARFLDDGIWQSISSLLTLNSQIICEGRWREVLCLTTHVS